MLCRQLGSLEDVVSCQMLSKKGSHCTFKTLHEDKVCHGQKTAKVLQAQILRKGDPVYEVDDGGEDKVGALLHLDYVLALTNPYVPYVPGSLEVLGPESKLI